MNNLVNEQKNSRVLVHDEQLNMKLCGSLADSVKFLERNQMCEVELWKKFVNVFRLQQDNMGVKWTLWRSEFWGKMMRGASMVVAYTHDDGMYRILEMSVRDMLSAQEPNGRISGYAPEKEFEAWDIWGRKYVMLGMMYFLEICRDKALEEQIIKSLCRQADYILENVGEGKREIRKCSKNWEGMNSCSILEPMVRLYRLTADKRYLDFAEYIVSTGFIESANIIELACEDKTAPHEYPVVKAYEMMSCFEGLLQYYCVTGIEKYKTAVLNFGRRIVNGEVSIIGCCGARNELFNHTSHKQTQTDYTGIVQETCVTVTWMKFAAALLELSGDVAFADCIEQSYYNAYVGAMNTHRVPYSDFPKEKDVPQVLPFDSYSPLVAGRRGRRVGGYGIFPDGSFYGCCACIGAAGAGIIPRVALLRNDNRLVLNYYEQGVINSKTPANAPIAISMSTEYPYDGKVEISLSLEKSESFALTVRVPAWCTDAHLYMDNNTQKIESGYYTVEREWKDGDKFTLNFAMPVRRVLPPKGADNENMFAAYCRGPLVLAADNRITNPDAQLDIACDANGTVAAREADCREIPEHKLCVELKLTDNSNIRLIDYASAGKTWTDESKTASWLYR